MFKVFNKFLFGFVLLAWTTSAFSQIAPSDGCGTPPALPVNSSCVTNSYTLPGTFSNGGLVNASCATGGNDRDDGWYRFVATGTTTTVDLTGDRNKALAIFSGCPPSTELACDQAGAAATASVTITTVVGTTYYVQVHRRGGTNAEDMTGTICVYSPVPGGTNDDPCGATALTVGTTCTFGTYTNAGATGSGGVPAPGCASYSGGDVWFTVTVPASGMLTFDSNTGVITDGGMAIYSGTCGALTLIECDDDDSFNGLMPFIELGALTPGATLWIRFWEFGNNNNGTFNLCVYDPFVVCAPTPANDNPCSATAVPVNTTCTFTQYTNACATATGGVPAPGCASYSGGDVWFSVTVPAGGDLIFDSNTGVMTDGGMAIYSGTCGALTLLACNNDGSANGAMPAITANGLTPGSTIWIRFWEFGNNNNGTFSLCVTEPPPPATNVDCSNMDPICSDTPTTFTAGTGGTDADVANPGNDYGCLFTSPNPSWYYLELLTNGTISMNMSAGSDIDFALWGPYPDLATAQANCNAYPAPIDCSYSISATEQANVIGALANQVYVLLVTNYANVTQVIDLNSGAGNTALTDCSIVLPIELVELYATTEYGANTIHWTTLSELSNDAFVIERSYSGSSFEPIGMVDGAGNSSVENVYSFEDRSFTQELAYYRLKQVDFDGAAQYSGIVTVNRALEEVLIFPNPTTHAITIEFPAERHGNFTITYRGLLGKELTERITIGDDVHSYSSTLFETLSEGIYIVEITDEDGTLISLQKVVKGK